MYADAVPELTRTCSKCADREQIRNLMSAATHLRDWEHRDRLSSRDLWKGPPQAW